MGHKGGMGLVLKRALDKISDEYDFVIIDCPPVLAVSDATALSAAAGGAVVVVHMDTTTWAALDRSLEVLLAAQVNVVGIIATHVRGSDAGTAYDRTVRDQHRERV